MDIVKIIDRERLREIGSFCNKKFGMKDCNFNYYTGETDPNGDFIFTFDIREYDFPKYFELDRTTTYSFHQLNKFIIEYLLRFEPRLRGNKIAFFYDDMIGGDKYKFKFIETKLYSSTTKMWNTRTNVLLYDLN